MTVVVGIDPGITTGLCRMEGELEDTLGSGKWDVSIRQMGIEELFVIGCDYVEASWRSESSSANWWVKTSVAGIGLCMHVLDAGPDLVVCEDYILRPGSGGIEGPSSGIGGRDAIVPVALTAGFTGMITQMVGRGAGTGMGSHGTGALELLFSSPSAKAVMTDERLRRWFGGIGRGKPHGMDALRHACLGIRRIR